MGKPKQMKSDYACESLRHGWRRVNFVEAAAATNSSRGGGGEGGGPRPGVTRRLASYELHKARC